MNRWKEVGIRSSRLNIKNFSDSLKCGSFFSSDPAKNFPYEIGETLPGLEDKSIWTLHHGKKKATGDPVTVFAYDVKAGSETLLQTAKTSLKRIKTLRHPNILTFLDGVEVSDFFFIYESRNI